MVTQSLLLLIYTVVSLYFKDEAAAGISSIRRLRERQDHRTRFDDIATGIDSSNQVIYKEKLLRRHLYFFRFVLFLLLLLVPLLLLLLYPQQKLI